MDTNIEISDSGISLLKGLESFRKYSYWDNNGYAICFGNHYHPNGKRVLHGDKVSFDSTSKEADDYILTHLSNYCYVHFNRISVDLKQHQVDALCSFIYNVGSLKQDLIKAINNQDDKRIENTFKKYNTSGGKVNDTLVKRRDIEYNLFSNGIYEESVAKISNLKITPQSLDYASSNIISSVLEIAANEIGTLEDPIGSNRGPVEKYLESVDIGPGNPWCAAFVYWCFKNACDKLGIDNPLPKTGLVAQLYNFAIKNFNVIKPNQSQLITPGCIFIEYKNGESHTGLVKEVIGGDIYTIEGNTGKNPGENGYGVFSRRRTISKQTAFISLSDAFSKAGLLNTTPSSNSSTYLINGDQQQPQSVKQTADTPESSKPSVKNYTLICNDEQDVDTMQKFIDFFDIDMTPDELLAYSEYDNKTAVVNSYKSEQRKLYGQEATTEYLGLGVKIAVPFEKVNSKSVYSINQTIAKNQPYNTFIEAEVKSLFNNPKYKKLNRLYNNTLNPSGDLFKRYDFVRVWVWSKSLEESGVNFFDLSMFIGDISTNVNINGGNFSISLPHIVFDKKIDMNNIKFRDLFMNTFGSEEVYGKANFIHKQASHTIKQFDSQDIKAYNKDDNDDLINSGYNYFKRNESFFHRVLKNNDVVFIRLEQLVLDEKNNKKITKNNLSVSSDNLSGEVLDMIGMIDSITKTTVAEGNQHGVSVSGRDLSKLLLEDGTYFFPIEYAIDDREKIIKNSTKTKTGNRLIIEKTSNSKSDYENHLRYSIQGFANDISFNFDKTQSIEEWMIFIFSQLTNTTICPSEIFRSYPEKNFIITRTQDKNDFQYTRVKAEGIWQGTKLVLDPEICKRRIADTSFTSASGSLLNLIKKVVQPPFAEFSMDTFGDKYYFTVRKPPYAEQSFKTNFCVNIFEQDVLSDALQSCTDFYTWYKLNPAGSIIDTTDQQSLAFFPAVMFPEYMEIWGNKILDITTQYLDFDLSFSSVTKSNLEQIQKQGREDLDWLIETHAYLPFTSEGVITIKPDRRIKRGMNIRYLPTGEVFHVDGVSHRKSFAQKSVNHQTILHVSRGMVEKHLDKYFKVINLLRNAKSGGDWDNETWTVNKENFDFLLKGKQFYK